MDGAFETTASASSDQVVARPLVVWQRPTGSRAAQVVPYEVHAGPLPDPRHGLRGIPDGLFLGGRRRVKHIVAGMGGSDTTDQE